MRILFFIALGLLSVEGVFGTLRQIQMLQQNGYYPARYFRWLKGKLSKRLLLPAVGLTLALAAVTPKSYGAVLLACVAAVSSAKIVRAVNLQRHSTIKLKFTARVKRLLAAECLLFAAAALLPLLYLKAAYAAVVFTFIPPIPTLLGWALTYPLEKAIAARYTHDAKRRLRSVPGLITIGVTGSYGKTGTKSILARILQEKYNTLATPESYNTPMGVVRTVRERLRPETEVFVAEMGAKRRGNIAELCRIADPSIGIVTSVGPQHLDTFGSVETVKATKLELADYVAAKGGKIYLNGDNEYLRGETGRENRVFYGEGENCSCRVTGLSHGRDGLRMTLRYGEVALNLATRLLGAHNAVNIAGAAAVALDLGVEPRDIEYAVSTLKPVPHRLEPKTLPGGALLIDDAYNSNPHGAAAALSVLKEIDASPKILVTPGMVELGEQEERYNREFGSNAAGVCDIIILVGEERAVPIRAGALAAGFDEGNIYVEHSFAGAFNRACSLVTPSGAVLLENDLPDNYLK